VEGVREMYSHAGTSVREGSRADDRHA